jgi:hypothetical protein
MRLLGLVIGALVILASAISFAVPDLRLSLERSVMTPTGLDTIAALRIAIGLVFVFAAPASRAGSTGAGDLILANDSCRSHPGRRLTGEYPGTGRSRARTAQGLPPCSAER